MALRKSLLRIDKASSFETFASKDKEIAIVEKIDVCSACTLIFHIFKNLVNTFYNNYVINICPRQLL